MKESLFIQYVQSFFKGIVLAVVEKLNGSNATTLRYRFMEMLTRDYSVDGKWESIIGEHTNVAADVVAMDSDLPLKKRDSMGLASGDIPKMGMKMWLNEKQLTNIDTLIARNTADTQIAGKLFADTPKCISGVYERCEDLFLQGLSSGISLAQDVDNVGTGIRVDFKYKDEHKFGVSVLWIGNPTTCKPIDDITRVLDQSQVDGNTLAIVMMDRAAFNAFVLADQVKQYFAAFSGIQPNLALVAPPDLNQVNAMLTGRYGLKIDIVDRTVITEKNGKRTPKKPWQSGIVIFLAEYNVGSLVHARLAEVNHPAEGVTYQTADEYILISKYHKNDPSLAEFTSSQARVLPVISAIDTIYQLDSKTVEA